MVDQYGALGAEKDSEHARQFGDWQPGPAKGARVPTPGFGQGRRAVVDQGSGVT